MTQKSDKKKMASSPILECYKKVKIERKLISGSKKSKSPFQKWVQHFTFENEKTKKRK